MGYRTILQANSETVQDLELSAWQRLDEAKVLYAQGRFHAAIYIAGLSAEMYLKTACFFVDGAKPGDAVWPRLSKAAPHPRLRHDLWFWCQQIIALRRGYGLTRVPNRFQRVIADIHMDWFNEMRYRPGSANENDAERFIFQVEWIANNHTAPRRLPAATKKPIWQTNNGQTNKSRAKRRRQASLHSSARYSSAKEFKPST